jgi:hypothetical protein
VHRPRPATARSRGVARRGETPLARCPEGLAGLLAAPVKTCSTSSARCSERHVQCARAGETVVRTRRVLFHGDDVKRRPVLSGGETSSRWRRSCPPTVLLMDERRSASTWRRRCLIVALRRTERSLRQPRRALHPPDRAAWCASRGGDHEYNGDWEYCWKRGAASATAAYDADGGAATGATRATGRGQRALGAAAARSPPCHRGPSALARRTRGMRGEIAKLERQIEGSSGRRPAFRVTSPISHLPAGRARVAELQRRYVDTERSRAPTAGCCSGAAPGGGRRAD